MAGLVNGRPTPETTETVADEDWYGEDLDGRSGANVEYVEIELSESTSHGGLDFTECIFRGTQFGRSSHSGALFANCVFIDCDFFGATFTDCKFLGSSFFRCKFDRLKVAGGDWSFVALPGADLRTSTFENVRMHEADLTGARCGGATLRGVDWSRASLGKIDLGGADLRGSNLTALDPGSVNVRNAVIDWQQAVTLATNLGLDVRSD
jgi:fluoroquinolone resistance protein